MVYNSCQHTSYQNFSSSFSGKDFNEVNKKINEDLINKKKFFNGFNIYNITLKEAMIKERQQNLKKDFWIFAPDFKGKNFDRLGFKDKKDIISPFGRSIKKMKFRNGTCYVYNKKFKSNSQYFTVYVFVDDKREIVSTRWYLN